MSRWSRGQAEIEQLLATNQMQQVVGGQADGTHLLEKAARTLKSSGRIADQDPDSAYILAYDASPPTPRSPPCRGTYSSQRRPVACPKTRRST